MPWECAQRKSREPLIEAQEPQHETEDVSKIMSLFGHWLGLLKPCKSWKLRISTTTKKLGYLNATDTDFYF